MCYPIKMNTASNSSLFYHGIQSILKSWTALQLAVSHGFGGPHSREKAQWLVGVIETFFKENDSLELWEVENFIAEIMSNEFSTVTEDNSLIEVSESICEIHKLWCRGRTQEIHEKLQKLPCVNLGDSVSGNTELQENLENGQDDVLIENMNNCDVTAQGANAESSQFQEEESKPCQEKNVPDADGWIEIKSNSRRKKK